MQASMDTSTTNPYTRRLADFAADLSLDSVPDEVVARAKSIILDGIGCGLFGAKLEWARILCSTIERLEPSGGHASIWGSRQKASAVNAALANGTMVQGFELDDANPAAFHSCAAILPAAFAAAELVGAEKVSGKALLTAIVAGFETGPRIGQCIDGNKMMVNGWHTPGIVAPFPAALSAGLVLGLNREQLLQALGIGGPQAAGLMAAQFGSMVKRMLSAKGAQSGLYAALLAAEGFTGINDVFEAPYGGYCTTFTQSKDQFDLASLTDGLNTRWETMRIAIKRHSCVGTNLAALDVIESMMQETGLRAADVERVHVAAVESAVSHSYWTPYVANGLTAAQMHMGWCIAVKLTEGEVFVDQMTDGNIGRADLVDLANRVTVVRDIEREKKGRPYARGAAVQVHLKDGRVLSKTEDFYLGSYMRPMTDEQMAVKYRQLAAKTLAPAAVAELEAVVRRLDDEPNITRLVELLRGA